MALTELATKPLTAADPSLTFSLRRAVDEVVAHAPPLMRPSGVVVRDELA